MDSLLSEIRIKYNTLSKNQKNIADYILQNLEQVTLLSISDLASNCDTSETTVMRFLKKLDYASYQIFRINLAKELSEQSSTTINDELKTDDDLGTIKTKVLQHATTALQDLDSSLKEPLIAEAVEMIENASRIILFGIGASSAIALDAMHKFGNIGMNVCTQIDPHIMNTICAHTSAQDLLLTISHTGESREVINAVTIAKKTGAKIMSLTSYKNSTLAKLSDLYLLSSTNGKKYHSEAIASRILQLTIIDILYISIFMRNDKASFEALTKSRLAVSLNKT